MYQKFPETFTSVFQEFSKTAKSFYNYFEPTNTTDNFLIPEASKK